MRWYVQPEKFKRNIHQNRQIFLNIKRNCAQFLERSDRVINNTCLEKGRILWQQNVKFAVGKRTWKISGCSDERVGHEDRPQKVVGMDASPASEERRQTNKIWKRALRITQDH